MSEGNGFENIDPADEIRPETLRLMVADGSADDDYFSTPFADHEFAYTLSERLAKNHLPEFIDIIKLHDRLDLAADDDLYDIGNEDYGLIRDTASALVQLYTLEPAKKTIREKVNDVFSLVGFGATTYVYMPSFIGWVAGNGLENSMSSGDKVAFYGGLAVGAVCRLREKPLREQRLRNVVEPYVDARIKLGNIDPNAERISVLLAERWRSEQ